MTPIVRASAYVASQRLSTQGLTLPRSHISEIIAALLGYRTLAALTSEEADSRLAYHLDDAEVFVLNRPSGDIRAQELRLGILSDSLPSVVTTCIDALKATAAPARVFVGIDDFYDSYAREALSDMILFSDEVSGAMGECNANFPNEPEMPIETPPTTDLWEARTEWFIEADGNMGGEYDPDGDRMFNGSTMNCRGKLIFAKAGRAGLIATDSDAFGGIDDSWRDQDHEAEQAYLASERDRKGGRNSGKDGGSLPSADPL